MYYSACRIELPDGEWEIFQKISRILLGIKNFIVVHDKLLKYIVLDHTNMTATY